MLSRRRRRQSRCTVALSGGGPHRAELRPARRLRSDKNLRKQARGGSKKTERLLGIASIHSTMGPTAPSTSAGLRPLNGSEKAYLRWPLPLAAAPGAREANGGRLAGWSAGAARGHVHLFHTCMPSRRAGSWGPGACSRRLRSFNLRPVAKIAQVTQQSTCGAICARALGTSGSRMVDLVWEHTAEPSAGPGLPDPAHGCVSPG